MLGSLIVLGSIAVAITYAAIARDLNRRVAGASADLLRSHAGGGRAALLRAIEVVKSGKPALIDTVTRHR